MTIEKLCERTVDAPGTIAPSEARVLARALQIQTRQHKRLRLFVDTYASLFFDGRDCEADLFMLRERLRVDDADLKALEESLP
jgi:hypothetical protein